MTTDQEPVKRLPEISIVMPSFNQVRFLEEAVDSVFDQDVDVELVVQDPGSTDGSLLLLEQLRERYGPRLVLNVEPDSGQSEGVNRGMAAARADLLGWLNSDDRLRPGALRQVVETLKESPGDRGRWLYGTSSMIDAEGRVCRSLITSYKRWRGRRFSRAKLLTENFISQMAVFFDRTIWEQTGGLDESLQLDMDYDLWFRFSRLKPPVVLAKELSEFRIHGNSKGSQQTQLQLDAAWQTALRYAPELGARGQVALVQHRFLSLRTRVAYLWLSPS